MKRKRRVDSENIRVGIRELGKQIKEEVKKERQEKSKKAHDLFKELFDE